MANDNKRKDAAAVIADLCGDPAIANEARREVASENELKPCPFCGGKARMSAWVEQSEYSAYCTRCGATAGDYRATEAEAVAAWNRRAGVGVAKMETTTHGNTPTVREVLKAICDYWDYGFDNNDRTRHFSALAKDALAAPVRNCDTMPWREAWQKWLKENGVTTPRSYAEAKCKTTAFLDWYTGEAKEGGNDGNEQ